MQIKILVYFGRAKIGSPATGVAPPTYLELV